MTVVLPPGLLVHAEASTPVNLRIIASPEPGWPQFRGPRRDGISTERGLLRAWPENGPKSLWQTEGLGRGYSSPVITGDRIFITGDIDEDLRIIALDLNGQRLWETSNGRFWRDPYPGSRSSVNVRDGRVYSKNAHGRLAAFDAATGKELWAVDLLERWGGDNITWGLSECVVVDDHSVMATVGGRQALAVSLDRITGNVRWISPPLPSDRPGHEVDGASYVSPVLVEAAGRRLLIGCALRQIYGIDADTGDLQWVEPLPTTYSVLAMTPVVTETGFFMTAPHGKGGRLWSLSSPPTSGGRFSITELWNNRFDTCQGGAVAVGDRLYGSYYQGRKGWAAFDLRTGDTVYDAPDWTKGSVLAADGQLYVFSEDGWLRLVTPQPTGFQLNGQFRFTDQSVRDAWAHPVILNKRLYLRYHDRLVCYDIQAP